jgi:membrane-bound serine protease (ClpP class)
MDILLDPNVAYLFLAGGLVLVVLALLAPGTGLLEAGAFLVLMLAGWETLNLPVNWWALVFLLVGAGLFVLALRKPRQWGWLVAAILALVIGSAFLFRSERWWIPAVNPFLALIASAFSASFFWIAARKILEAWQSRPSHDPNRLIGKYGEARTAIHQEGSVQVSSELWSARSEQPIHSGKRVRIVGREGLVLLVEAEESEAGDSTGM